MKIRERISRMIPITMAAVMLCSGCGLRFSGFSEVRDAAGAQAAPSAAADVYESGDYVLTEEPMAMVAYESAADMAGNGAYMRGPAMKTAWGSEWDTQWNTEEYSYQPEHGFISAALQPLSTFAADVDTASYANLRRQLMEGRRPVEDSIRAEEIVNYFHYDYPEPQDGAPFSVTTEIAPCPWNEETKLLLIGLQAKKPDMRELPPSSLTFLIDVSGSMDERNKLPLVQRSFMTLVENLRKQDIVSIVTYSGHEEVVLDGVRASEKNRIMAAIEGLYASGSTNGESALKTAYEIAGNNFIDGGNNRIIMATDGDFNVGVSGEGELTRLVEKMAGNGIYLSVLGYGMGNYKDNRLESIADHGNGNYAYIDTIDEARKVLVGEAGGTLFAVADDVKLQVDFNPAMVKGYRLIGYEDRRMEAQDFADDTKDGGEIGAGHSVTALYEIVPAGSEFEIGEPASRYTKASVQAAEASDAAGADPADPSDSDGEWLTVCIRYKDPGEAKSRLIEIPVTSESVSDEMSDNLSWAAGAAQIAMLLQGSEYAGDSTFENVKERLKPIADDDFKEEFIYLINKAKNAA